MKSVSQALAVNGSQENWALLIEVSAREVFELMLGCQLIVPSAPDRAPLALTSMVGLTGQLCGLLIFRCGEKAAALMTSKMLGVPAAEIGAEVQDAVGEICNMVAGNFKNKIAGLGDGCMLSTPTVISGGDYKLHSLAHFPSFEINLLFEGMPIAFVLEVHSQD